MALLSFLDRELSVAHPGYSRWLVPPAALAIHLSIGQVYAFSVFKIPLTQLLGVGKSMPDDWKQTQIAWIFSLAIVMLGLSAATFGKWLEGAGPRKAMFALSFPLTNKPPKSKKLSSGDFFTDAEAPYDADLP